MCIPRDTHVFRDRALRWRAHPSPSPRHELCRKLPPEESGCGSCPTRSWDCSAEQMTTPPTASSSRSVLLLRSKRPSRSWCALLMEEQVRGGLLPHETFLWGAVASATPLRGRCGGAAKERIRGRQGLERRPAFRRRLPSALLYSLAHLLTCSYPPQGGQLVPCR